MFFYRRNLERKEKGSLPNQPETGGERISLSPFHNFQKGSMTVEASCIIPLFLLCMAGFLMFGNHLLEAISVQTQLAYEAKMEAIQYSEYWWKNTKGEGQEIGSMISKEKKTEFSKIGFIGGFTWIQRFHVRTWTGRNPDLYWEWEGEGKETETVYIALNGEVYHTDPQCSHIHLSIRSILDSQLDQLRNDNGEKYHACELCGGGSGSVYITDSGNRYHSSLKCSGLKRSILEIPLIQMEGLRPCSRCC